MRFVNRVEELHRLDALAARQSGGLVVLWGRRRVGKTRLLLEWCARNDGVYTVADQSAEPIQRRYLAEALSGRFPGFGDVVYPDWRTLLRRLAAAALQTGWRGPLILDEFPYLAAVCPALPSILQNWVDHEARDAGLLTVIAGSSQRMMQGLVLNGNAPLYGRASEILWLRPLAARFLREALGLGPAVEAVQAYAVWGGIPRYWELAEPHGSGLDAAVDALALDPMGPLHREPDRLLLEELPPAVALRPILDVIGAGAHRLSEIAARMGQPATSLSRPLLRLTEMGLVERQVPFGQPERSGKRALYRIADPFFRFWFRVVAPHRALLAGSPAAARRQLWTAARAALFAEAWENLCRQCVPRLSPGAGGGIDGGPWGPAARFWAGGGCEWDVVARSVDDRRLLLAEAKWPGGPVTEAFLTRIVQDLLRKGVPPIEGAGSRIPVHAVFVPSCPPKLRERFRQVQVLDAEAVVEAAGE